MPQRIRTATWTSRDRRRSRGSGRSISLPFEGQREAMRIATGAGVRCGCEAARRARSATTRKKRRRRSKETRLRRFGACPDPPVKIRRTCIGASDDGRAMLRNRNETVTLSASMPVVVSIQSVTGSAHACAQRNEASLAMCLEERTTSPLRVRSHASPKETWKTGKDRSYERDVFESWRERRTSTSQRAKHANVRRFQERRREDEWSRP